jgi:hypothetical protein
MVDFKAFFPALPVSSIDGPVEAGVTVHILPFRFKDDASTAVRNNRKFFIPPPANSALTCLRRRLPDKSEERRAKSEERRTYIPVRIVRLGLAHHLSYELARQKAAQRNMGKTRTV